MQQETTPEAHPVSRRLFLKLAGFTAIGTGFEELEAFETKGISLVVDPADAVANAASVLWAAQELALSLTARRIPVQRCAQLTQATAGNLCIVLAGASSSWARQLLKADGVDVPAEPEALGLILGKSAGKQVLLACGHDERGLMYAVLELADRIHIQRLGRRAALLRTNDIAMADAVAVMTGAVEWPATLQPKLI